MNLLQIFPDAPVLAFGDKEYSLEYSIRSELELERDYGSYDKYTGIIENALDKMETSDIVNFLQAGLLHTDLLNEFMDKSRHPWRWKDRDAAKSFLISQIRRADRQLYILAIAQAFVNSMLTPDQAEMLDIMAAGKKKELVAVETNGSVSTLMS